MSNSVTVILPIYNIRGRGFKRVLNSVYSLQKQNCDIIIVDGSEENQYLNLKAILKNVTVRHLWVPMLEFNKPRLLNIGIKYSKTEYIFCSDADYIFSPGLIDICERERGEATLLHKKVKMLPAVNITTTRINNWRFPACKYNVWNTLANGAMQYSTRKFFTDNPYNDEMSGFGAMDNLTTYVAFKNGFNIVWVEDGEILHQHHPIEKKMSGENMRKFERNQKVLADYIKKYRLPKLLSK